MKKRREDKKCLTNKSNESYFCASKVRQLDGTPNMKIGTKLTVPEKNFRNQSSCSRFHVVQEFVPSEKE